MSVAQPPQPPAWTEVALARAVALAEAGVRAGDGGPFGAVVVRVADGAIVGEGWNRVLRTADPTAHAEVVALRDASAALGRPHLDDCAVVTTCEPCPMCLGACQWARVAAVYFAADRHDAAAGGFDDRAFYDEFARPAAERRQPLVALGQPEAARRLFRLFHEVGGRLY